MAFPVVQNSDTTTGFQEDAFGVSSHPITLPANRSVGDRIVVCIIVSGTPAVSGWPIGWSVRATQALTSSSDTMVLAEKIISGGESNFTLSTSSAEQSTYHAYRISGAHLSQALEATGTSGGTSTIDFPNLDPSGWGTEETLWMIFGGADNGTRTVNSWPSGYTTNNRRTGTGTGAPGNSLASAWRTSAAASENPATLTWSAGPNAGGITVAIRPQAASTLAGSTRALTFHLSGRAQGTRALLYNVAHTVPASLTRQLLYNVSTPVGVAGTARGLLYNLIGRANKTALVRFDVRTAVTQSRIVSYYVAGPPTPPVQSSIFARLTEEQAEIAMLRGTLGQIQFRYRMYKSDKHATPIRELSKVENASFSLDNFRDHTWELSLPMDAVDYFDIWGDWVRLEVDMEASGYEITRPFGHYFFMERGGEDAPQRRFWQLTGRSAEARLMGSTAHAGYSAPAGTGCLANVRSILLNQDVPANMILFPPAEQDVALGTTLFFDPFQSSTDTRWLRICNLILAAGGFLALFTDNQGRFNTRKVSLSNSIEAAHTYGTNGTSDHMIVSDKIPWEIDDENFANRVVVYSGDPAEAASYGVAENHDPNSRVSYERLGYWKQADPIELPALVSPAEAQMVAMQALRAASGANVTRTLETNFDTRIKPRQAYGLEVFDDSGEAIVSGDVWTVLSVSASLDLSPMQHEVMQAVSL